MLLRCLSLEATYLFRKSSCCVFAQKLIEIEQNTKVQVITSTIDQFITKVFSIYSRSYEIGVHKLLHCEIAYMSLLSKNDRIFAKITKNIIFGCVSSFFDFSKK